MSHILTGAMRSIKSEESLFPSTPLERGFGGNLLSFPCFVFSVAKESNLHLHDSKMVKDIKSKCYGTHGEQPAGAR